MKRLTAALLAATAIACFSPQAASAESIIDEVRFGGTWAQPTWLDGNHAESDQFGINAELLFAPFDFDSRENPSDDFIHTILTPRFHIGALGNLDEDGTSYAYAGLTWHQAITDRFFVEFGFGGSYNNGSLEGSRERVHLGSHLLFRESIALGYNVTERMNVILQFEHNSHLRLAGDKNRGLSNVSLKAGFSF